jgi:peptidoglycan/LPS O-acetylase OafA/YrhL
MATDLAGAILVLALVDAHWGGRRLFQFEPFMLMGLISSGAYRWHRPVSSRSATTARTGTG